MLSKQGTQGSIKTSSDTKSQYQSNETHRDLLQNAVQSTPATFTTSGSQKQKKESSLKRSDKKKKLEPRKAIKKFKVDGRFRFSGGKEVQFSPWSLFIFSSHNRFRQQIVQLIEWKLFDQAIIFCILCNSILLAAYDYSDREDLTKRNKVINQIGDVFSIVFFLEALLKILAMGLILHKKAYLRDFWNILDFLIAVSGFIEVLRIRTVKLSALRTLRVLRPLKSINSVPSIRRQVKTLLSSLPELLNVSILISFVMLIFAIFGLQTFSGVFYNRCRENEKPVNATYWPKMEGLEDRVCGGSFSCPIGGYCGNSMEYGISLKDDGMLSSSAIQFGVSSFDNFFQAILAVFQIITFDSWTTILYNLMDGSIPVIAIFFCVLIVVICSFFMLNLVLAVIFQAFLKTQIAEAKAQEEEEERKRQEKEDELEGSDFDFSEEEKQMKTQEREGDEEEVKVEIVPELDFKPLQKNRTQVKKNQELQKTQIGDVEEEVGPTQEIPKKQPMSLGEALKAAREEKARKEAEESKKSQGSNLASSLFGGLGKSTSEPPPEKQSKLDTMADKLKFKLLQAAKLDNLEERLAIGNKLQKQNDFLSEQFKKALNKKYHEEKHKDREQEKEGEMKNLLQQKLSKLTTLKAHSSETFVSKTSTVAGRTNLALEFQKQLKEAELKKRIFKSLAQKMRETMDQNKLNEVREMTEEQFAKDVYEWRSKKNIFIRVCLIICLSKLFSFFITICIFANTYILALDSYPANYQVLQIQEFSNWFFFIVFLLEMGIKMVGMGFTMYFRDNFNTFDAVVVILSVVDIAFSELGSGGGAGAVSALRAFRLLRVFKLAKSWQKLQDLLLTMSYTLKEVSSFSLLLAIFVFIYSLLGMNLFGYKVKFKNGEPVGPNEEGAEFPAQTFNTFIEAFLSVFIVMANDGWSTIYLDHYRAQNSILATFFFVSLLIVGQYMMLNLFLAILLQKFDEDSLEREAQKEDKKKRQKQKPQKDWKETFFPCIKFKSLKISDSSHQQGQQPKQSYSLFLFSEQNYLRKSLLSLVKNQKFDYVIMVFILISTLQLAIENPLFDPESLLVLILYWVDLVLTAIFVLEAVMKITAFGFLFCGKQSYLREAWNVIDFTIVVFSLLSFSKTFASLGFFKVIRLIRILRPLRVIAKNEGLKICIQSLIMAFPNIINVTLISFLFFLIFGIIGINYLKGAYFSCQKQFEDISVTDKWSCLDQGGEWKNFVTDFDDIGQAMITLWVMANIVGWAEICNKGMASKGIDKEPERLSNSFLALFFIFFIIFGALFQLNLFVGEVITTYNRQKDSLGDDYLYTENQKKFLEVKLQVIKCKPKFAFKRPDNRFREQMFLLSKSTKFDIFIIVCICLNTLLLSLHWYNQDKEITDVLEIINYVFTAIFTIEIIIKLFGFGKRFFKDGWNNFDFIIVLGAILGLITSRFYPSMDLGSSTTIIRTFRIARVIKLMRTQKGIKTLFTSFIATLPALGNVGGLLVLILFIYSTMGVQLFATVKINGHLNDHLNFQSQGSAFITLLRASTGENWHYVLHAISRKQEIDFECVQDPTYEQYKENDKETVGCGSSSAAKAFMLSYSFIVNMIFLNLFIAIILQGFDESEQESERAFSDEDKEHFRDCWAEFDPDATGKMNLKKLRKFFFLLGPPLGWDYETYRKSPALQKQYIEQAKLQVDANNCVNFKDVIENVSMMVLINKMIQEEVNKANEATDKRKNARELEEELKTVEEKGQGSLAKQVRAKKEQIKKDSGLNRSVALENLESILSSSDEEEEQKQKRRKELSKGGKTVKHEPEKALKTRDSQDLSENEEPKDKGFEEPTSKFAGKETKKPDAFQKRMLYQKKEFTPEKNEELIQQIEEEELPKKEQMKKKPTLKKVKIETPDLLVAEKEGDSSFEKHISVIEREIKETEYIIKEPKPKNYKKRRTVSVMEIQKRINQEAEEQKEMELQDEVVQHKQSLMQEVEQDLEQQMQELLQEPQNLSPSRQETLNIRDYAIQARELKKQKELEQFEKEIEDFKVRTISFQGKLKLFRKRYQ